MYGFVGLPSEGKTGNGKGSNTSEIISDDPLSSSRGAGGGGGREQGEVLSRPPSTKEVLNGQGHVQNSAHAANGGPAAPLTAEERLRNLMESMQKQAHASTRTDRGERDRDRGSASSSSSSSSSRQSHPSLYELANMDLKTQADGRAGPIHPNGPTSSLSADPLSAFDLMQQQQQQQQIQLQMAQAQQAQQRRSSTGGGAIRARHDVVTNARNGNTNANQSASGRASVPRKAWGASSTSSSSSSRPPSPSSTRHQDGGSGSSSSANIAGGGVGSGSGSNSRVYRHGSPSPNNTRMMNAKQPTSRTSLSQQQQGGHPSRTQSPYLASGGGSVASISTIGSGLSSGAGGGGYGVREERIGREREALIAERDRQAPMRGHSPSTQTRYASPSSARYDGSSSYR